MRIRRSAAVLAVGVTATLVPALAPAQASAADPLHGFHNQRPAWHRCDTSTPAAYQCATIDVPLDYSRPTGRTIKLAISRMKADGSAARHGAILFNPGGPGANGLAMPVAMNDTMPKDVRERYDLIGFDPRGVGRSTPVTCGLTAAERKVEHPYRPETFNHDVTWARSVAEKCRTENGDMLRHITTRNTARDMDVIRAVLGEKKISYLGFSYGTYLGAVYTQMFPQRTDRFVLDSAVDPARVWRGMIQVWAEGAEPAFTRWTKWTAQRDRTYHLGSTPTAVKASFWDLVARADRDPIPYENQKLSGDDLRAGLRPQFFSPIEAAETVAALKAAAEGKPTSHRIVGLDGAPAPRSPGEADPQPPVDNGSAVFWSVVCGDTAAWPRRVDQYRRDAIQDKARHPLYGDFGSNITPCPFWTGPAEPVTTVHNDVRLLTVQNQWDPQTPLVSGLGMHRALTASRMVYVEGGEGHGVYSGDPRACANRAVNAYLSTGKLPTRDLTCEASASQNAGLGKSTVPIPHRVPGAPGF
ncbi:alpha/beta fold hydrolase [Streptomyces yunnanensis]|uniref:Alpha/beta fold hydrolase n=1 Tax=Streptomyces yunnanensis TaxID=156453 RepID=A0ABY8AJ27_9ACTN|nr:alpha/beta hydrolase [Streptomyces yunnanensis]WEB45038.1 alpha/beta fold hydrolase [Streptomyces yunnanensis]